MYDTQNKIWLLRMVLMVIGGLILMPLANHLFGTDGMAIWVVGALYGLAGGFWANTAYD